jgi:hypothetical protein
LRVRWINSFLRETAAAKSQKTENKDKQAIAQAPGLSKEISHGWYNDKNSS